MEAHEYENLGRVEDAHWYYAGKREFVAHWLARAGGPAGGELLDFGAGTGRFAATVGAPWRVSALDAQPESLAFLRTRFPAERVLEPAANGGGIPLGDATLDAVTALDVLEHLRDDAAAVAEFRRTLKPGGIAVVTVPASMKLWSDWDVSLQHFRRYDRAGLGALFADGWTIECLRYTNVVAFPAVWWVRSRQRRRAAKVASGAVVPAVAGDARPEDKLPPRWLNALLKFLFVFPARQNWIPAPFGVSLLLVARKK